MVLNGKSKDKILKFKGFYMVVDSSNEIFMEFSNIAANFQISLKKESERGSAIVCATLLEESLYRMIKARLTPSSEKKDELLEGAYAPLGTFSAKIDLAYRIGLISLDEKSSFHLIRKIRNEWTAPLRLDRLG